LDTAIIIGASTGIGRTTALRLADSYNNIAITSFRHRDELMSLKKELDAKGCHCLAMSGDAGDMDFMERFIRTITDTFGDDIDLLVNNAGCGYLGNIGEIDTVSQTRMIDLNLRALTAITNLSVPYMDKGSRILNVSSIASFCPTPRMTVYSATKAYVSAYTIGAAEELKAKGYTTVGGRVSRRYYQEKIYGAGEE